MVKCSHSQIDRCASFDNFGYWVSLTTTRDTVVVSILGYLQPVYWRSSYDGLDTDNSSVYGHFSVSSIVLVLKMYTYNCPRPLTYYYSLDMSTTMLFTY